MSLNADDTGDLSILIFQDVADHLVHWNREHLLSARRGIRCCDIASRGKQGVCGPCRHPDFSQGLARQSGQPCSAVALAQFSGRLPLSWVLAWERHFLPRAWETSVLIPVKSHWFYLWSWVRSLDFPTSCFLRLSNRTNLYLFLKIFRGDKWDNGYWIVLETQRI